jgi:hypothetical protein
VGSDDDNSKLTDLIEQLLDIPTPAGTALEAITWAAAPDGDGVIGTFVSQGSGPMAVRIRRQDLARIEHLLIDPELRWQGKRASYERSKLIDVINPEVNETISSEVAEIILAAVNNRFHAKGARS